MTQKITPNLWFNEEAVEAAEFYTSIFPDSKRTFTSQIKDTPSGDCDIVRFELMGYEFQAINAGLRFKPNPSISFMVNFDPKYDKNARKRVDEIWDKLSEGGKILMPLDTYPFSERYGWIQDKYGFSWQLIYTDPEGEDRPRIIPSFLFITDTCDKAEEATGFYLSVFKNTKRGAISRYPADSEPNKEDSIMFTDFKLEDEWFAAMDGSTRMHDFTFNEAISLVINCSNPKEIDYYWDKLSAVPEAEQCGWVKDKYGVSWQILPQHMDKSVAENLKKIAALLKLKKILIADLEKANKK